MAACKVAGPRPSDRQPGAGAGSFLAPPGRGGREGGRARASERAAAPRAGAGRLRPGPASGGSQARAGGGAGTRPRAGPWPMEARGALSGCAADTGWAERIGCGGRGPACRPDSRVGVPGRRSVRCARTLPAAAPLPRPPGRSGLAAAGSPEPPEAPAARQGGPGVQVAKVALEFGVPGTDGFRGPKLTPASITDSGPRFNIRVSNFHAFLGTRGW